MFVISGELSFAPHDHDEVVAALVDVSARSRADDGCVEYWWGEDVERADVFHFFECWASREQFEAHRVQPYEDEFMQTYVSRITGARAHQYDVSARTSATGE